MRYRLAVFMLLAIMSLLAMLPRRSALAAPAPEPYAILDIGPPPRGETMAEHRKSEIGCLLFPHGFLHDVWRDKEVRHLASVTLHKDARPWLSKNLRVTATPHTHHVRLEFRGGDRTEQVAILNSLLRNYLRICEEYRQWREEIHRKDQAYVDRLPRGGKPSEALQDQMSKNHTLIAAYKQIAVVRWAK